MDPNGAYHSEWPHNVIREREGTVVPYNLQDSPSQRTAQKSEHAHETIRCTSRTVLHPAPSVQSLEAFLASSIDATKKRLGPVPAVWIAL